ncbi:MAG: S1C family serine protease [Planctomycetaceae bacterium]
MEPRAELPASRSRLPVGATVNSSLVLILLALVAALIYRDYARHERAVIARGDLAQDEAATVELFKRISPSVVHVDNVARQVDESTFNVLEVRQGSGSGFVWDSDGHVVTNFHVIQRANSAWVTLADNTRLEAKLVGFDESKDVAVLKVDGPARKLKPIPLGTSYDLEVGQKVFAIGSPFELDLTLTSGIIGGLGREIESVSGRPIQGVIQTDAAINPGNSGGPLLDSAGRLIGVTTAIKSPTGSSVGIGFAVPVDTVKRVVTQLIRTGKVERAGLGVNLLDDHLAARRGIRGVLIRRVTPNSAAAKAGLRGIDEAQQIPGDVIVEVDGYEVLTQDDLYRVLDLHEVGDTLKVKVLRDQKTLDVSIKLQALVAPAP